MKTDIDAIARLRVLVKEAGSQKAAAERLGCAPAHVGDLLKGYRTFSDRMLERLGLRRTIVEARS